ncbi:MAG: glycosyltransferase family 1 protein [Candidatus Aureabacteria bacterium]|nr:glycosyltransferase family 1 protein [Candidatus Auribacterota bacterium]
MHIAYDGRILVASQRTGIGRYTYRLIELISGLCPGQPPAVFYPRGGTRGEFPGEMVRTVHSIIPGDLREDRFLRLWYDLYLPFQIRRRGIDLFHGTSFLIPRTRRARTVVTVHDLAHEKYPELAPACSPDFARRVRQSVARADAVIAKSCTTRDDILELFHVEEGKLRVIYEGVNEGFTPCEDMALRAAFLKRYGMHSPYIFSLLPLHPRKNIPGLLSAFSLFKKRTGLPHSLTLGGKEYEGRELLSAVERLGISESFTFVGYIPSEDLRLFYSFADAFIFPSLYEGFGIPPLEAMACGTPVLASRGGSMPEVLGPAARYFDPKDTEEMAHRLAELLGSESERVRLREKGFAQAHRYRWDNCARETLALYKELCG